MYVKKDVVQLKLLCGISQPYICKEIKEQINCIFVFFKLFQSNKVCAKSYLLSTKKPRSRENVNSLFVNTEHTEKISIEKCQIKCVPTYRALYMASEISLHTRKLKGKFEKPSK